MKSNAKIVDPLPDEFSSYEEAAEFWNTHDTTDYLDCFETVEIEAELRNRIFQVEIDEDLIKKLSQKARQQGVNVTQLVNTMLREAI